MNQSTIKLDHHPNQEINHTMGKSRQESLKEAQHIVNQADRTTKITALVRLSPGPIESPHGQKRAKGKDVTVGST
jgi:hypothetical protein